MLARRRVTAAIATAVIAVTVAVVTASVAVGTAATRSASSAPAAQDTVPAASPSTASPSPGHLEAGSHAYSLVSGGLRRTYRVYLPTGIHGPAPLVVMLHGGGGSGAAAEHYYGWDTAADAEGFVVAYPDALGSRVASWNVDGGGCCGQSARQGVDDVAFITALVGTLESEVPIDRDRVYVAGISNGGILAYTLACRTHLFAAVAAISATQLASCAHPNPTSIIHIHGLDDPIIPFGGGAGSGVARIDGPPVTSVIEGWRQTDGCASPPAVAEAGPVTSELSPCPGGRAVELITIAGAGHGWPGSPPKSSGATAGGTPPSQALNATAVVWSFFAAHPAR